MRIGFAGIAVAMCLSAAATPALADGDSANGEKVFRKCKACHAVEAGKNKVGPTLHNIVGRTAGTVEGFRYSDAMTAFGEAGNVWDDATLSAYLEKPKDVVPKTTTSAVGLATTRMPSANRTVLTVISTAPLLDVGR